MRRRTAPLAALGLAVLCLCSLGRADTPQPPAGSDAQVVLARNFMFAPLSMTVTAGSTVTWTNHDEEPHTVVSESGLFRSGALDTNESFSFRFDKPGTYRYACSIHPQMVGTIVVR
jgi:plastocyanin